MYTVYMPDILNPNLSDVMSLAEEMKLAQYT